VIPSPRPILILLVGPNGSGKSTLYETRVAPRLAVPFINADIIQRDELNDRDLKIAYEAARMAEKRRRELMDRRKSFATETVFSHPSKLDLIKGAKASGYRTLILHISVESPDLSVARVAERVKEGGHDVPEDKIRSRYDRNGQLIRQAVLLADGAHIYDNSSLNTPPVRVLSFVGGELSYVAENLPQWALEIYAEDLSF